MWPNKKFEAENLNRDESIKRYKERMYKKDLEISLLNQNSNNKGYTEKWKTIYKSMDKIETKLLELEKQRDLLKNTDDEEIIKYLRMIF